MKVLFDNQLFSYQRYGGASKYFVMLLKNLPREMWDTTTVFSNNEYVESEKLFSIRNFLPNHFFRGQGRIMNELNKPYTVWRLRHREDYNVFHQTHFEPFGLKAIGQKPMVTTFHDTNFSTLNPNPKVVRWQAISLKRADAIIAVSENTKKDLLNIFDVNPDKVHVIYHGIEDNPYGELDRLVPYQYVLYVGTRKFHKNFDRFIQSFKLFVSRFPELHLVCTWKNFSSEELKLFCDLGISDKVHHIAATELQMHSLYQHAVFFIFPSLYEGFGMPILEAMQDHCPVVISNASCFPEIAGNAALYFDPMSIDDMSDKMIQAIENENLRKRLVELGNSKVKEFSWKRCADKHINVYKSLL